MGTKHAAVDMRFINNDCGKVAQEVGPLLMSGQNSDMKHVGIGEYEV